MALIAEDMRYEVVQPARWKKAMVCDADKTMAVARAEQLFPDQRLLFRTKARQAIMPDRAEAAMMARYGAEFLNERGSL